jgi:hypothetical protein
VDLPDNVITVVTQHAIICFCSECAKTEHCSNPACNCLVLCFGRTKTEDCFELLECLLQQINVAFLMQLYYNLQKDFSWLTSFYCHRMSIVHRERYEEIAVELNSRIVMRI